MAWQRNPVLAAVRAMIPRESYVLVAVSGGVDSMSLLHALLALSKPLKLKIGVAHINHGVRPDSAQDGNLIEEITKLNGLAFHLYNLPMQPPRKNFEGWARKMRYQFLTEVRNAQGYDWILTAHTADDLVETYLMRLISGKDLGEFKTIDHRRRLIRPFLELTKESLLNYVKREGVRWREDSTNSSDVYLRNRVRNGLIPALRTASNSNPSPLIHARAKSQVRDQRCLKRIAKLKLTDISNSGDWGSKQWTRSLTESLKEADRAIGWRIVSLALLSKLGYPLGEAHCARFIRFILSNSPKIQLPGGFLIARSHGGLSVTRE